MALYASKDYMKRNELGYILSKNTFANTRLNRNFEERKEKMPKKIKYISLPADRLRLVVTFFRVVIRTS